MNDAHHEYHNPSGDEPVSNTQRARLVVQHILGHLDEDDVEGALDLFDRLHPADQAEVVAAVSDNSKAVLLASVDSAVTARVLEHLEPEQAAQALEGLRGPELVDVLGRASPDVAADVIKQMPIEKSAAVLAAMGETDDVVTLIRYPDESAGGLMTTDFPRCGRTLPPATPWTSFVSRALWSSTSGPSMSWIAPIYSWVPSA